MPNKRPHIVIREEAPTPVPRQYLNGGGSGVYPRPNFQSHANSISTNAAQVKAIFAASRDRDKTNKVYYKVKIVDTNKFETTHGQIVEENFFAKIVGSPEKNVAYLSSSKAAFNDVVTAIETYRTSPKNSGKSKFSEVEELSNITFEEKATTRVHDIDENEHQSEYLIGLYDDMTRVEETAVVEEIKSFVNSSGGEYIEKFETSAGPVVKIKSKKDLLRSLANSFVAVQSVDVNEDIMVESAYEADPISEETTVLPNTSSAYAAVFDSGVKENRLLSDSLIGQVFPFGRPQNDYGFDHGTMVASRVIYGDTIKEQSISGVFEPDVKVLSVCIKKYDSSSLNITKRDDVVKVIRKTVEEYHQTIRVYNLSIAFIPRQANLVPWVQDNVVHPVAAELDALAKKYNVLFVISAGNFPFNRIYPEAAYPHYFNDDNTRILPPSESMLNVCVGSIAKEEIGQCMARANQPSPFTRRGPGYSGFRKPDVVAHGGNTTHTWADNQYLSATGISPNGNICYANGTSFSAPLITRIAAKIFEQMPTASASLVKALIIHSSSYNSGIVNYERIENIVGNGIPDINSIFSSTKSSQNYVYDGELGFRDVVKIPFYIPSTLTGRTGDKLKISVTITYSPETRASLSSGYCKSHIRTKIIKLDNASNESDINFSDSRSFESERYNTVIRMEKLITSRMSASHGEWQLLLAHESRWNLTSDKIKVAAVITISDPQNSASIDIFNSIRTEVPNRFQNTIQIPTAIIRV